MFQYIIRRLLLMIPVFFGITILYFVILQIVPGGPLEQEIMKLKEAKLKGSKNMGSVSSGNETMEISAEALEKMKKFYGFDKPIPVRYLLWLGVWPRVYNEKIIKKNDHFLQNVKYVRKEFDTFELQKWIKTEVRDGKISVYESPVGADFEFDRYPELPEFSDIKDNEWQISEGWKISYAETDSLKLFKTKFSGVLTGDLGESYEFREPVVDVIFSKVHISLYFGIIGFILSYIVCIPLGIYKAVKRNSAFDMVSSVAIFVGYSIPAFALGALLLMWFGGGSFWDVFPLGGFRSDNFDTLSTWGKITDQIHHTFLPVICYAVGSFTTLTILMKNSIIDNLSQDYVRTAFSKGLTEKRVIFRHALRNSLIPLATGIGGIIGIFLSGSFLIEKVFNIDGMGMLGYMSLINRDYPVSLGFLVIGTGVMLIGNLISDLAYALIDPRIRFK